MEYLETINNPIFIEASHEVHRIEARLQSMGLTLKEARGWIMAWASGAGDGIA